MKENMKKWLIVGLLVIVALISIFGISKLATSTKFHEKNIESLDQKRDTVLKLTAASTATSAVITLIPGDVATPIAEKLADLSTYFLMILCAIFLEKYLLTLTGYATFTILIPAACLLLSVSIIRKNETYRYLAKKIALFGILIVLVVPFSIKVSNLIEGTYQETINQTLEKAEQTSEKISEDSEEETGISAAVNKVTGATSKAVVKLKSVLNNFIEAIAVMIITSCILPILVLIFFSWIMKIILGIDVQVPNPKMIRHQAKGYLSGAKEE